MQYNQIFNQPTTNSRNNTSTSNQQTLQNASSQQQSTGGVLGKNIFSRNIIVNPINANKPNLQPQSTNPFNKNTTSLSNNTIAPSAPSTNSLTMNPSNSLGAFSHSNPFNKASNPASNIFTAKTTQPTPLNTAQNGNNAAIFNNNLNNASKISQSLFNNNNVPQQSTNPTKIFQNTPNNQPTSTGWGQNLNINKPQSINGIFTSQTVKIGQQDQAKNLNPTAVNPGNIQFNNSQAQSPAFNAPQTPQMSIGQINSNSQSRSVSELQRLMENVDLNDSHSTSPFNLYHCRLMMCQILAQLERNKEVQQITIHAELGQMKIKDFPFAKQILIMIKQMKDKSECITTLKEESELLSQRADSLIKTSSSKLSQAKASITSQLKIETNLAEMERQIVLIKSQLNQFVRPLLNAYEGRRQIRYSEPDDFSLEIAKSILIKITLFESSIDNLATQTSNIFDQIANFEQHNNVESSNLISRLTEYFEAVCIKFETLKERFEFLKATKCDDIKKIKKGKPKQEKDRRGQLMLEINRILRERQEKMERALKRSQNAQ